MSPIFRKPASQSTEAVPAPLEEAKALVDRLVDPSFVVDRFDASYLQDLPDILREQHGIVSLKGRNGGAARALLKDLLAQLDIPADTAMQDLPGLLRERGLRDAWFMPKHASKQDKKKQRYTRISSWKSGAGLTADKGEAALEIIRNMQVEYSRQSSGGADVDFDALSRTETGDPWTGLMQGLIKDGVIEKDEQVMTIGPRWAGEIRYFRQVVGFENTIGLDLFSNDESLVKVGDMHAMPFEDDSFGLIYQRNTFNKAYDIRKALDECVRVLRPGGVLISDDCLDYTEGVSEVARTNMKCNAWMIRCIGDHVDEVLWDKETPATDTWLRSVGQVAIRIKK